MQNDCFYSIAIAIESMRQSLRKKPQAFVHVVISDRYSTTTHVVYNLKDDQ